MKNEEFKNFINDKMALLSAAVADETLYNYLIEHIFFDAYNLFINILSEYFDDYSIGIKSDSDYLPKRKLKFDDIDQFHSFLYNRSYIIEYLEKIKGLHHHIFESPSPFDFCSTSLLSDVSEMKIVRDYIGHKSARAKSTYIDMCPQHSFIEPFSYLNSRKKKTNKTTRFKYYIDTMLDILEYVRDPRTRL